MNIVADSGIGVQKVNNHFSLKNKKIYKKGFFFEICHIQLAKPKMKIVEI